MRKVEIEIFNYEELSDDAKAKAREWYASGGLCFDYWEQSEEDLLSIHGKIEEFCLEKNVMVINWHASMDAVCNAIRENHGDHCDTYKASDEYLKTLDIAQFRRSLERCYLEMIRKESDYYESDKYFEDSILANEYEFTSEGRFYGDK